MWDRFPQHHRWFGPLNLLSKHETQPFLFSYSPPCLKGNKGVPDSDQRGCHKEQGGNRKSLCSRQARLRDSTLKSYGRSFLGFEVGKCYEFLAQPLNAGFLTNSQFPFFSKDDPVGKVVRESSILACSCFQFLIVVILTKRKFHSCRSENTKSLDLYF